MNHANKILNIGIIAHVDAGKTTLTENILYLSGAIKQVGRVDKGNTQTDSMAVERRRGISVRAAATSFYRGDIKFNLIDTPGHVDFVAEVERNFAVLDGVVLVISAKEGLQSQTRILMDTIRARQIPAVIFVNKVDRMGADVAAVVRDANKYMGGRLVATQHIAKNEEETYEIRPMYDEEFIESAADTILHHDDILMEKFARDEEITAADLQSSLIRHAYTGNLYPVLFGSALYGIGVESLLDALPLYFPIAQADNDAPLSAAVFKVDNSGKRRLVFARIYSGVISFKTPTYCNGEAVGFTRLAWLNNGKMQDTNLVGAGDIAVLYCYGPKVGDVLGEITPKTYSDLSLGRPTLSVEVTSKDDTHRIDLYKALARLADEDPLLALNGQNAMTVQLFGEVQLEILHELLAERYNMDVELNIARTIHMETVSGQASAVIPLGKSPFRAGVGITVSPSPRGSGIEYVSDVPLGELEKSFQVAVEDAVYTACRNGVFGWEMTDMRIVFDYSDYDSVTSTPSAFRNLVPLVLMEAVKNAAPILLEPIMAYELRVPSAAASKALYDLRMMNATVDSTENSASDTIIITGHIPVDSSRGYATKVGSYTEGLGIYMTKFSGYRAAEFAQDKVNESEINPAANPALYLMQKMGAR